MKSEDIYLWNFKLPSNHRYVRTSIIIHNVIRRAYEPDKFENRVGLDVATNEEESDANWMIKRGGLTHDDYIAEANCGNYIP